MTDITAIRQRVQAWSAKTRELNQATSAAADERARAFIDAYEAGIPLVTIAADAEVHRSAVSRSITRYLTKHGLEQRPTPPNTSPTAIANRKDVA